MPDKGGGFNLSPCLRVPTVDCRGGEGLGAGWETAVGAVSESGAKR